MRIAREDALELDVMQYNVNRPLSPESVMGITHEAAAAIARPVVVDTFDFGEQYIAFDAS
jgi:hypothetical protein